MAKTKIEPMMRLSTAIKLGRKRVAALSEGGDSGFFNEDLSIAENKVARGCVLTCAALATDSLLQRANENPNDELWRVAHDIWHNEKMYTCPQCNLVQDGISAMAIHIFDSHTCHGEYSFTKLVNWVKKHEPWRDPLERSGESGLEKKLV
jgi:hypothetical protein